MFTVIVIIFQVLVILFIGIFARTNTAATLTSTYYSLAGDCMALMFAFTLLYTPFRKLSLSSLGILLIVIGLTVQTNILFETFWTSCFNGFSSSFQFTITLLIRCLYASLAVLLTALDFIGLFGYWQVFFIMAPIMGIGYSLFEAILVEGLSTFDGGGGMTVFLYSGVCSLMIWALCIRGKINPARYKIKESNVNQTLGFIGVMIGFVNWPKFNMGGAYATTYSNVDTTTVSVVYLQNSALANTFLGLSSAILTSILFASKDAKEDKLKFRVYIDCFINGGIVIACYQDIALNPAACITLSCVSSIVTVIVHKYFITASETDSESMFKTMMKNYSKIVFRILFAFISSIIASIVVASRNGTAPELLASSYSKIAGFQILAALIGIALAIVFGAVVGFIIKTFLNFKAKELEQLKAEEVKSVSDEITDLNLYDGLNDEMHPLYYDIFEQINNKEEEQINIADYTTLIIKQALLGAQDNPLRMVVTKKPFETRVDPKPAPVPDVRSQMQEEGQIQINKPLAAEKSKLRVSQAEKIPPAQQRVARRLNFSEDVGSQIKNEKSAVPEVKY